MTSLSGPSDSGAAAARRWHRLYWICQVGGWSFYAAVNLLWPLKAPSLVAVGTSFAYSACGLALSHALRAIVRRHAWLELPMGALIRRVLAAVFLLAAAMMVLAHVNWWVRFGLLGESLPAGDYAWSPAIPVILMFNMSVIFMLWSGLYFGIAWWRRQQRTERERLELQVALADARFETLLAQVNPHFLFNCLNSLRALVTEDAARAQESITQLSALLRYTLRTSASGAVTLAEEIRIVEAYLALERLRLEDRLVVRIVVPPETRPLALPAMAVLTLVENAIKHGVARQPGRGEVEVHATCSNDRLTITVRNTGRFTNAPGSADSLGVGLRSVRERVEKMFGSNASFAIGASGEGWVAARLEFAARRIRPVEAAPATGPEVPAVAEAARP